MSADLTVGAPYSRTTQFLLLGIEHPSHGVDQSVFDGDHGDLGPDETLERCDASVGNAARYDQVEMP